MSGILLIEDDPLIREATRLLLEASGYEVREAGTAEAALASIAHQRPALVLLDLGLPDRPGLDVARALEANATTRDIPVIAVTGRAGDTERTACMEAGCRSYFVKPVPAKALLERVARLLSDE